MTSYFPNLSWACRPLPLIQSWKCILLCLLCQMQSPSGCLPCHHSLMDLTPFTPTVPCFIYCLLYVILNCFVCVTASCALLIIDWTPREHRHFFKNYFWIPSNIYHSTSLRELRSNTYSLQLIELNFAPWGGNAMFSLSSNQQFDTDFNKKYVKQYTLVYSYP